MGMGKVYKFSKKSKERLFTCDDKLQLICNEAIKRFDFSVLCGYRNQVEQDIAYRQGKSKLKFPNSKHNKIPAKAVDIAPYNAILKGIDWNDINAFILLSHIIKEIAYDNGIRIRYGGDWEWKDWVHFELV